MAVGFVVTFLIGGLTGIYLASPPLDFFTHDTYFVVAHFHSVVMALLMGAMGGLYYWGPKFTGYLLNERIGKTQFWFLFIGTQVFTFPQYLLGLKGMPRRIAIYPHNPEWKTLNDWSSFGALLIGISTLLFIVNIVVSWKKHPAGDNPWDAHTLEWDYNHPDHRTLGHGSHKNELAADVEKAHQS